jgi:hypothetical protein
MLLSIILVGTIVCAVVLWRAKRRHEHTDALGWMSERWLAEQRSSRQ